MAHNMNFYIVSWNSVKYTEIKCTTIAANKICATVFCGASVNDLVVSGNM